MMALRKRKETKPSKISRKRILREVKVVEGYEYLLVEYLKQISSEMTYLVLIVISLFLFILLDLFPTIATDTFHLVKIVLVLLVLGGFALFGVANITKRKIERKFELIFRR